MTDSLTILNSSDVVSAEQHKPSLYNYFVDKDETVWCVNFSSGALMKVNRPIYQKIRRVLAGERGNRLEDVREQLIRGRFLIPETFNEIALLKTKHYMSRFSGKGLTLVVAPTLRCNFACAYCYVDRNANKMRPEDRVRVGKFFHNKLPAGTKAEVVWTGGDPSLAMDVVADLSHRFLTTCEEKGSPYSALLITNGYLLDSRMRDKLASSQIAKLQVSLDGSKEFHDQNRCLPKGEPTYDRILDNVANACDQFGIFVRINVDAKNKAAIPDLLDDLEERGLRGKLWLYFAHVDDVNENSAGYHDSCLEVGEYARVEARLLRMAIERGFSIGNHGVMRQPVKTFCGANSNHYYVIDSNAKLLKCYHDLGAADINGIGAISDDGQEVVTNPYNLFKWLSWDPFEIDECRNCKVLPLCMGGCSHKIMNGGMDVNRGCVRLRFTMDEIVDLYGDFKSGVLSSCRGCAAAPATS